MMAINEKTGVTLPVSSSSSIFNGYLRTFFRNRIAAVSVTFVLILILVAIFAPLISPYSPNAQDLTARNLAPGGAHLLGTDDLGRDQLSRLMHGARITLSAPLIAAGIGIVVGTPTGVIAGFYEGAVDWFLSRAADVLFSIPGLVLAMTIVGIRGPSTTNAMIAVGVVFAPRIFRVVRSATLKTKHELFVEAARSMGAPRWKIILRHIIPNIAGILTVQTTVLLGLGVLTEAGLSFLGIGVQPPGASWGVILRRTFDNIYEQPFGSVVPGLLITLLILSLQFIGDALHETLGKGRGNVDQ